MTAQRPHAVVTICYDDWHEIGGGDTEIHFVTPAQMTLLTEDSDSYPPPAEIDDEHERLFRFQLDVVLNFAIGHGLFGGDPAARNAVTWRKKEDR